jgi:hypothetical protein
MIIRVIVLGSVLYVKGFDKDRGIPMLTHNRLEAVDSSTVDPGQLFKVLTEILGDRSVCVHLLMEKENA